MACRINKLMIQVALYELSIAELLVMEVARLNRDGGTIIQILARLSRTDRSRFLKCSRLMDDMEISESIEELMGEKSTRTLRDDLCLSNAICQGRA